MNSCLHPGCMVILADGETGVIRRVLAESEYEVMTKDGLHLAKNKDLKAGFKVNQEVEEIPSKSYVDSLGAGVIRNKRTLGKKEQCLVEFWESGKRVWVPFENLRLHQGVRERLIKNKFDELERFRLRTLAYALELWNENTGAMSKLDIDPLPHQIHLVHHILASGNLNWLIADDVGLGKTIETGMLLKAISQRGPLGRVLLVTPAGLTRQWQEELEDKFGFTDFDIAGDDFPADSERSWRRNDKVIISMDRMKAKEKRDFFLTLPNWDLVIFDEAHRLSERQYGNVMRSSERFKLARLLRKKTENLILLTATPHQGRQDSFKSLLRLIRPELEDEIAILERKPELLKEMMFRNHKELVTDGEGSLVFKGKEVTTLDFPPSEITQSFDAALQKYLSKGYRAGGANNNQTRAIGFVMTVYRKLASSSMAAIHSALIRRLDKLTLKSMEDGAQFEDERFGGEEEEVAWLEAQKEISDEFFGGEIELLKQLITYAEVILEKDEKLECFLNGVIKPICNHNSTEKVLIFSEYRATQSYIKEALICIYGDASVDLINGSMTHQERRAAINNFEENGQFLISTEAGGEGINLQRYCHTLVNFDLPWNPMRIAQRIGRLYRYGQKKKVVIFNIHIAQSLDTDILQIMYGKLDQVVADLAPIGGEFNEGMKDDLLGQLCELAEVENILTAARGSTIEQTKDNIDAALVSASVALEKQRELFQYAQSYDAHELVNAFSVDVLHLKSFLEGMFVLAEIEIVERIRDDRIWKIKLPESFANQLKINKRIFDITFDKEISHIRQRTDYASLEHPIVSQMLKFAKSTSFGGLTAVHNTNDLFWSTNIIRWQSEQGKRIRREFLSLIQDADGKWLVNPKAFADWLKLPLKNESDLDNKKAVDAVMSSFKGAYLLAEDRLAKIADRHIHPESIQELSAAVCAK